MSIAKRIASNLRSVYQGSNWVGADLKATIEGLTWEQATTEVHGCNSIATLVFHMTYYIRGLNHAFDHGELTIKDKWSFDYEPITCQEEWEKLVADAYKDVETFASKIEALDNDKLESDFLDGKYGSYYRNVNNVVEHCQYHLGQIVLLKKIITS